ncbi:hypothetical protein EI555_001650, partial [Monodon monoceros]
PLANITAGHLLLHLIGSATLALIDISLFTALITFTILTLLIILEFAVALIQAYVFTLLTIHNDPPNPLISYSKPQSLTPYRSSLSISYNIRPNHMIPFHLNNPTNFKLIDKYPNNIPMMTRHCSRKHFPRPPHTNRSKGTSIWYNLIYPIRSPIFYRLLLSLLSFNLIEGNRKHTLQALLITIILGLYFTLLQASEYYEAPFTISDGSYGSTFFVATGFHGLHLIIGSTFLIVCFMR